MRLRVFNGSHLTLPSSSQQITLRPHQKNAVWRIVQSDNTLLAHVVGAGKTYTMVAAAIELKRLGLRPKPMFVVPNHMLAQFSSELLTLYPDCEHSRRRQRRFRSNARARLFSRIATGNWDAVIVTHSSFEKIPVSLRDAAEFIATQIEEIEMAIREGARGTRHATRERAGASEEAAGGETEEPLGRTTRRTTRSHSKNSESTASSSTRRTSSRICFTSQR